MARKTTSNRAVTAFQSLQSVKNVHVYVTFMLVEYALK